MNPDPADIAAMRAEGSLRDYIRMVSGQPVKPAAEAQPEPAAPCYHIRRPGAWPCGTAATGPTPELCSDCRKETR